MSVRDYLLSLITVAAIIYNYYKNPILEKASESSIRCCRTTGSNTDSAKMKASCSAIQFQFSPHDVPAGEQRRTNEYRSV